MQRSKKFKIKNRDDLRFLAFLVATAAHEVLGTCDRLRAACGIVSGKRLRGVGYNGSVSGLPHCDQAGHLEIDGHCKRTRHAEANAVQNTPKEHLAGSRVIVNATACIDCVKELAEANVARIDMVGKYGNSIGKEHIRDICKLKGIHLEEHNFDWEHVFQEFFNLLKRKGGMLDRAGYGLKVTKMRTKRYLA